MTTATFIVTVSLYIAAAVAQRVGEATKQQPEMRRKGPGLHQWYVPPKSRNIWAQILIDAATLIGLVNVVVTYLMQ